MAIAMAGMLTARLQTLPNGAWSVVFGVLTAWFGYRVTRDAQVSGVRALAGGHCAPHLVHAGAMLYMFVALTAPAAHGSGGMAAWRRNGGMGTLQPAGPGVRVRAGADRLQRLGSGPDLRSRAGGHYSLAVARRRRPRRYWSACGPGPRPVRGPAAVPSRGRQCSRGGGRRGHGQTGVAAGRVVRDPGELTGTGPVLVPWVATACRIAMGVTMAFMLLIMI